MTVSKIHSAVLAIAVAVLLAVASSRGAFAQSRHHAAHDRSLVVTDKGPVRGTLAQDHREFLGIPYAAPPTGQLRWKAPVPHAAWTAALDATRFGPTCAQPTASPDLPSLVPKIAFTSTYTLPIRHTGTCPSWSGFMAASF